MAVSLVAWISNENANRLARVLGPRPIPSAVSEIVLSLEPSLETEAARNLTRWLMPATDNGHSVSFYFEQYRRVLGEANTRI